MAQSTRATRALEAASIAFSLHSYDYDPSADSIGLAAAEALGADPGQVFKTLMVLADGKPACVIAPSSGEVSMKKAAAALGAKAAAMMKPADAERMTGYKIGGISPFGQMRRVPAVIDETAVLWDTIFLNAGQRGLQVRLAGEDARRFLDAALADIAA
ncbi:Cys-tRNA(Pro) deacylase [Novosphingobium sp. TCA1]|uniref:Cys-tRNA(Pro)/Cys-tRNA(Cys) deacylase n=1 Tax=Novosphingobium pentaromativorans TaxID=205844 RepID=A0A2W5NBG2_9SPHN|nr:Cys-tRNA(Pro) deacylase [Novosphingobium sp. TCA1]PZQ49589.1 MAG: Cys-tRNA(Pro) deacylase [Novosphingobium pentaromativorans]GFE77867.1 Cys-tRNA(Pro)/Cys-tRNA(Cys) deacylase [Novosphingobium sp. TCA1]